MSVTLLHTLLTPIPANYPPPLMSHRIRADPLPRRLRTGEAGRKDWATGGKNSGRGGYTNDNHSEKFKIKYPLLKYIHSCENCYLPNVM